MKGLGYLGIRQALYRDTLGDPQHIRKDKPVWVHFPYGFHGPEHDLRIDLIRGLPVIAVGFVQEIEAQQAGGHISIVFRHEAPEFHKELLGLPVAPQCDQGVVSPGVETGHIVQVEAYMYTLQGAVFQKPVHVLQEGRVGFSGIRPLKDAVKIQRCPDKVEAQRAQGLYFLLLVQHAYSIACAPGSGGHGAALPVRQLLPGDLRHSGSQLHGLRGQTALQLR